MPWTREQKLDALMRLPWTVVPDRDDDEGYLIARVVEVPDAIATGNSDKDLGRDLWESLRASLAARLDCDDPIPVPTGSGLPWEVSPEPPQRKAPVRRLVTLPREIDFELVTN